jgi:hypothetical protein
MHFCTPVAVNPWIVFHIATCGGTRLRNENSLILWLTHDGENGPKTNDSVNGGDAAMLYRRCAASVGGFLFQADGARSCGSKGQAAKLPGGVADREDVDCG